MIPYKSRAGRAIRNFLGGTVGACAAFLMIVRAEAGEEPAPPPAADLAKACAGQEGRQGWAAAAPPAHVFGNTWYVGTCGITALLVTSDRGHVLVDGGVPSAAPLVAANIEKLGFRLRDVRWIVSSHEHDDHAGALAELRRLTGAKVAAVETAAPVLATGKPRDNDPQRAVASDFAPVTVDRVLRGGEELEAGSLRLTAYATPAHSPGSTSWTWRSCAKAECRTVTYADSATVISADDYRFTDHPERIAAVRQGLARIKSLPCDIMINPHPEAGDLFARLSGGQPLGDPQACRRYGEQAEARFADRLAKEAGAAK